MPLAVGLHEHLVQVPAPSAGFHAFEPALADLRGKHRTELVPPESHSFMAHINAALMEQIFHIAERQKAETGRGFQPLA